MNPKSAESRLCIGTANFGLKYGINKKKPLKLKYIQEILQLAKNNKINFLDTAISYKSSEKKIGLSKVKNFKTISKINNFPKKNKKIENWIFNKVRSSCKKLNVKKLYGLLIHDTDELLDIERSKKIFNAFDYLKKKNIVKHIGLSIYNPKELDNHFSKYKFEIVQLPINIFDNRFLKSKWLKKLKRKRIKIFARSIFLKGLLLKGPKKINKKFIKCKKNISEFEKFVLSKNISKEEACIRYILNFKEIDKIIIGINSKQQLINNISYSKKKKLIVPRKLILNDISILDPRNW